MKNSQNPFSVEMTVRISPFGGVSIRIEAASMRAPIAMPDPLMSIGDLVPERTLSRNWS